MKPTLRKDTNPNPEFYYHQQFEIYHQRYLIWDRETWKTILTTCDAYRLELDGRYVGDVILEAQGKGIKYIVDFSVLPDYQGMGIGRSVLEHIRIMTQELTAVTRKETLGFFLKSGFVLRKTLKNYYHPGVDGYYIALGRKPER
jgi:ribosomal protein S18 acetylase RimI-like enzyme